MTSSAPETNTVGVILCAGKGSRIDPFNAHYPKPLLPILNKPIMEHQIEHMVALGIRDIVLVVGHLRHRIQEHFGDGTRLGVRLRYVEQQETLGIAHAVLQIEPHVDSSFLLFLGDIFYKPENLGSMLELAEAQGAGAVLAVKREPEPANIRKNFSVQVDADMRVQRVVEKPRFPFNDLKGCGIYYFRPEFFDALRKTPRTALRDEYELTTAIQVFIDDGYSVHAANVVAWDYNITFPADLLDCNLLVLRSLGLDNVVDETARVHPDTELDGVVIGPGVKIEQPLRLSNSVILPNTRVESSTDIRDAILAPDVAIRCDPGPQTRRA